MFISVIVTAFNRNEFLRTAIDSVLNQTLGHDQFEIIVVKNFTDPDIDSLSVNGDVTIIQAGNETIGHYMFLGITKSRGDVITFLDDDDLYLPSRLEQINSIFSSADNILYYKNGWQLIDTIGKPGNIIKESTTQGIESVKIFDLEGALKFAEKQFRWNMSCIAVRKEVFVSYMDYVPKISAAVDLAVFYMAASLNGSFAHDPRILTQYRRHTHSMSRRKGPENDSFREFRSLSVLEDRIKGDLVLEDFSKTIAKLRILSIWDGSATDKKELRSLLSNYLRHKYYNLQELGLLAFIFLLTLSVNLFGLSSVSVLRKLIDPFWTYEQSLEVS